MSDEIPQDVLDQLISQYMAEQSGAPMMTGEQSNFYGAMPQLNQEGDPYTLTAQLNQLQDVNMLMKDPFFQGMGGAGGYSAASFEPSVRWEAIESPQYLRWQNYLNTPDSFEGMIAAELQGGGTPLSAVRKIRAKLDENPESALAQELSTLFPVRDAAGIRAGEIDWSLAAEGATEIDALRAEIPPLGGSASMTAPDGTTIPGTGEVMEIMGPDGRPQLVRRVEEPSKLMQEFSEQGLPSPFEQYTPESFMGPDWAAQDAELTASQPDVDVATRAMHEAYLEWLNASEATPTGRRNQQPAEEAARPNNLGTTDERLVGGGGIAEEPDDAAAYDAATGAMGGAYDAPPSMIEMRQIETAADFEDWYNTYGNRLTDDQRQAAVMQAGYNVHNKGPEYAGEWDRIRGLIYDDMTETEGGGGFTQLGDVGGALADLAPEPTESSGLLEGAQRRTTEESLRSYLDENAAKMSDSDLSELGAWASNQNWGIGSELIRGDYVPPGAGGGAGNRVQTFSMPEMEERYAEFLTQQGEPVPPPTPYARDPFETQLLQERAADMGPQVPDDLFMDPGYHNYWGPTGNPLQPYGLNDSYVDPGTTEQQWLYETGQRTPNVRGPGGWSPYGRSGPTVPAEVSLDRAVGQLQTQAGSPGYTRGEAEPARQPGDQGTPRPQGPGYTRGRAEPARQPGARDPMTAAMIAQIIGGAQAPGQVVPPPVSLANATRQVRTGERDEDERYDPLSSAGTGERVRRTDEERRALARKNAPQGLQGEEYNVLGGDRTRKGMLNTRWRDLYKQRSHLLEQRNAVGDQLYGAEFGRAVRAYLNAQQTGATPYNQVIAQRMQNIQGAGIPLGARPQVQQY